MIRGQAETVADAESPVRVWVDGRAGRIELNRPKAINALTLEMVEMMQRALDEWRDEPDVTTVVVTGAGDRGLCAGGDIVSIYQDALGDAPAEQTPSAAFWRKEYVLNATVATYPKPYVAIMDGIVLGGGVGISAHGSHRVVTERSAIGMPETGIGFVPDVGGTWLLARTPGLLGTHLGLTAGAIGAGDAIALGLADTYVPRDRLGQMLDSLVSDDAEGAIVAVAEPAPASELLTHQRWIDSCYAAADLGSIITALEADGDPAAAKAAAVLGSRSPTAAWVALRAIRAAAAMSLPEALRQELRMAVRFLDTPDFAEGVRAAVIDKDRSPRWSPRTASEVDPAALDRYFEPLSNDLDIAQVRRINTMPSGDSHEH